MPDSEAKYRWQQEHTTILNIRLNHNTDADILEALKAMPSKSGFVREAIREKLERDRQK